MDIVLIIAIPVLLILAAVMIFATGRRRAADSEGRVTGTLSAETRSRDQSLPEDAADAEADASRTRASGRTRRARRSDRAAPRRPPGAAPP